MDTASDQWRIMHAHFPRQGPAPGGSQTEYPGDHLDFHLISFKAAIEAGCLASMDPYQHTFRQRARRHVFRLFAGGCAPHELGFQGAVITDCQSIDHAAGARPAFKYGRRK
jgi:hypothetical protein